MTYKSLSSAMAYLQKTDNPERVHRRADNFREETLVFRIDDEWGPPEIDQAIVDVQNMMLSTAEDIASIRGQIEMAKAKRFSEKVWADPVWFARASAALRHKGRQHQSYQTSLHELKRRRQEAVRKLDAWDDNRMFINAAKSVLNKEQYMAIWDEVERRRRQ